MLCCVAEFRLQIPPEVMLHYLMTRVIAKVPVAEGEGGVGVSTWGQPLQAGGAGPGGPEASTRNTALPMPRFYFSPVRPIADF